jgi:peptidoglycan/xylan/chitin deacetylase (PgdA/CDA1 family)
LAVVTYHGISPSGYESIDPDLDGCLVSRDEFRRQLRLLKSRYQVVAPEEVLSWIAEGRALPERAVLLTCDEGLLNMVTDMAPILKEEHLSCLFFVLGASAAHNCQMLWHEELYLALLAAPSGSFSIEPLEIKIELFERPQRRRMWRTLLRKLSEVSQAERESFVEAAYAQFGLSSEIKTEFANEAKRRRFSLLNRIQLRELVDQGMSIGSHTVSHPMLSQQSPELAWKEISESRVALETAVGTKVWALAYPFGDAMSVTSREWKMAEQAGFECAFMNVGGGFGAKLSRFSLPRVHVTSDMSLAEFEAHVSGLHRALRGPFTEENSS